MLFLFLFLVGEIREGGKVEHQIVLPLNHLNRSYGRSGFINVGVCVFLVEVGRVRLAHQRRLPRRRDLLVLQRLPVQPVEERVRLDVLRVARTGAQTQLWVANQQARDEVGRFGGEEALHMGAHDGAYGELQRRVENVREHHLPVLVVEGRLHVKRHTHNNHAADHLVEQRAHRPPVHRAVVRLARQHLRRHVLGRAYLSHRSATCTADGPRLGVGRHVLLGESEVGDDDVALLVQQNVLRLEISAVRRSV